MAVYQELTVTEVAGSQNVANNTSKVRILWKSTQTGESWNGYTRTAKYYISINGGAESEHSVSYSLPKGATTTILDTTITVTHKDDGSGTIKVRTWMDTNISAGVVEKSASLTLATIPRASTMDSLACATSHFDGKLTYKYTPKSSGYYNRCNISLNQNGVFTAVKTINLGQKAASQQTGSVTLSADELAIIYNKLTNIGSGVLRFTLRTYSNSGYSSQVGEATTREITLWIPKNESTLPDPVMTLSPVGTLPSAFAGLYIQGKSKVDANFASKGKYGASIKSNSMSVDGTTYGSPFTSGYLSKSGTFTVTGEATDSRNYVGTDPQEITVIPYSKPKIKVDVCGRCDAEGNLSGDGTYLKIQAKRTYSPVEAGGVQKNFCVIRYRYKPEKGGYSSWFTILAGSDTSTDEVITGALLGGALAVDATYIVQVGVYDDIGESTESTFTIPTDKVYDHADGSRRSYTFGGYVEEDNTFAIAEDIVLKAKGTLQAKHIAGNGVYDSLNFDELIYHTEYYTGTSAPSSTGCSGYPVDKTGVLEVISAMKQNAQTLNWWGFAYQTYRTYDGEIYTRSYFSSDGWKPWKKVAFA